MVGRDASYFSGLECILVCGLVASLSSLPWLRYVSVEYPGRVEPGLVASLSPLLGFVFRGVLGLCLLFGVVNRQHLDTSASRCLVAGFMI